MFGITHTREIYEKAIEVLPDSGAREMCLRYAQLETKLGEIDRARAVYSHGSQMSDPRVSKHTDRQAHTHTHEKQTRRYFPLLQTCKSYWKAWQEFEVHHGNEDTFREMLRIKRSVQAQFNTQVCVQ